MKVSEVLILVAVMVAAFYALVTWKESSRRSQIEHLRNKSSSKPKENPMEKILMMKALGVM